MTTKNQAVAKQDEAPRALAIMGEGGRRAQQAVIEALDGNPLTLSMLGQVPMPGAGGKTWDTPAGAMETFEGVMLLKQVTRAYWATAFGEGEENGPPDCYAADGRTGRGQPGGDCSTCPYSEFGSDPKGNGGQACRQITVAFVLTPESGALPWMLRLPPSNYTHALNYGVHVAASHAASAPGTTYANVITRFALVQDKGGPKKNITYSKVELTDVRLLDEAERAAVDEYAAQMLPGLRAMIASSGARPDSEAVDSTARE